MNDLEKIFEEFLNDNKKINQYYIDSIKIRENVCDKTLVSARIGGSSGASCWDNSPSVPYRKDREDVIEDISSNITSAFRDVTEKLGISENVLELVANNFAQDLYDNELDTTSNGDYYGNYDSEAVYGVPISEFFEKILSKANFEIFEEVLNEFTTVENKAYQQKVLKEREAELEKKLATFDAVHAKEKQQLENQVLVLTKKLERYDAQTNLEKKSLTKSLEEVKAALEETPTQQASLSKFKG